MVCGAPWYIVTIPVGPGIPDRPGTIRSASRHLSTRFSCFRRAEGRVVGKRGELQLCCGRSRVRSRTYLKYIYIYNILQYIYIYMKRQDWPSLCGLVQNKTSPPKKNATGPFSRWQKQSLNKQGQDPPGSPTSWGAKQLCHSPKDAISNQPPTDPSLEPP